MAVSDYLQKSGGVCRYSYSKLKDVLYLVSAEHVKNVHIDNGEAYIDELTELPLRINGFNIQFNEETSLDERYKFQKTLTLSMHGYVNYKIFGGRYYAIIEDMEGVFYMINVDFPSRITHTFNLNYNTNQTDFTFASLSNFPTLKLNAEFEAVSPVCLGLNVYGIDKLELLEKEKARLDTINKQVISTESFKKIEFLGNSCSFQEVYDGNKVTDTITFNIALDNYKPSWQYNLLEFLDNRYSAIITPKGNDNKYYPGYNFGLQPSYTIQTSNNPGESDIITITLVEMSSYGSTSAVDWKDEQSTETRWRWVKRVGETVCFECIGLGRARYLVRQQVDLFGNPTGNYQVMEGYESEYPNFHIVDTFTTEEIFETSECSESESCEITSNIPNTIYFNAITSNTYSLKASCDWEFIDIPNNIAVEPITGAADTNYTVTISNTVTPTQAALENSMKLRCCKTNKIINLKTQIDSSCIRPQRQYINCLSQDVVFAFDGNCRIDITSIDSRLTYAIGNNSLTVRVPRNYGDSAITWTIIATNCDCSSSSTIVYINQDKQYERWVVSDGYTCENGNSYKVERKYTGTTQDNINTRTDETRRGELIASGDTRCTTSRTKWEWDGENYYCVNGNKFQAVFEYISYDDGTTWVKTGNTRLGDMVEESSDFCLSGVTYSWEITSRYECDGTTSYYLYQKYEQRGNQEPIPAYPNVFSKDGEGTMSVSKKQDNDPNCGYVPPVTPMYDWAERVSSEYICENYNKYKKLYKRVSYDNGATWQWVLPYETQKGTLIEEASTDCGYVANFERWVESGTTCNGENLYKLMVYQTSSDGINWVTTEQTKLGDLIEVSSSQCSSGYRWVATDSYGCHKDGMPLGNYKICGYRHENPYDSNSALEWFETPCDYVLRDGHCSTSVGLVTAMDSSVNSIYKYTGKGIVTAYIGDCVEHVEHTTFGEEFVNSGNNNYCVNRPGENNNIETVIFSDSVRTIDNDTFTLCFNLKNVVLSNNLEYIEGGTFYWCSSLSAITIPNSVEFIDKSAFEYSGLIDITIPSGVTSIGSAAFHNCSSLTSVTIGNNVTEIGQYAFADCTGLTSITIPNSVVKLGYAGFGYEYIGVFANCSGLTSITIGNGVDEIGNKAFSKCSSLTNVTIPSGVTTIGFEIFDGCNSLNTLTVKALVPPKILPGKSDYSNYSGLGETDNLQTIYVPAQSVDLYKNGNYGWTQYKNIIVGINM